MKPEKKTSKKLRKAIRLVKLLLILLLLGLTVSALLRGSTTGGTVGSLHDGVGNGLELLLLGLVLVLLSSLVVVEPRDDLGDLVLDLLLVVIGHLELALSDGVLEGVGVGLKAVLGLDTGSLGLILSLVLLGLSKHALDLLLGQTALVVGDGDLVGLASALLGGRDVHDTVGVQVEGNLNLGNTTGGGGDASQLELAEQVVVLGASTLTLEDLDQDTGLVVGVGGEGLGLLGGDSGVTLDQRSHDTTGSLDTQGQRGNIQKQDLVGGLGRSVTRQDSSLDGSTVGDGLIGVDGLVGVLVEEVGDELLDLGDTGGTTDQDDLVDGGLVNLGVTEDTLNGLHGATEEVLAELLETGTGDGGVEVDTLEEGVDLDGGLSSRGQGTLSTLASSAETTESTGVGGQVLLVLALELVDEVVDQTVVEVLTTQVSVTSSGLNLEDTLLDGQQGHIEGTTTQIEDQDVALTLSLLVKTVGNGSSGRLVNDTEDVETGNETGVLGSLTLRVVEVGRDGDNGVVNGTTQVGLSGLTHLDQDHSGNLLRSELLVLTLELNLNDGLGSLLNDLERPVLHIRLDLSIGKTTTDQTLSVEDSVVGVHGDLVLGGITDKTLGVGESNERGGSTVTLVVGDDLNAVITEHTHTGVGGTQIDTDSGGHCECVCVCENV